MSSNRRIVVAAILASLVSLGVVAPAPASEGNPADSSIGHLDELCIPAADPIVEGLSDVTLADCVSPQESATITEYRCAGCSPIVRPPCGALTVPLIVPASEGDTSRPPTDSLRNCHRKPAIRQFDCPWNQSR